MTPREGPRDDADAENELDRAAALRLMITMARAAKAVDACVRPHLAERGLSMTEFAVLEVLHHKGPLPLSELAQRILLTGACTTYTVKKLEERRLLRRRPSTEDQRVVFGELTAAGRRLIGDVFPEHAERLRRAMGGLSRQEKRSAGDLMRKLGLFAEQSAGEPDDAGPFPAE